MISSLIGTAGAAAGAATGAKALFIGSSVAQGLGTATQAVAGYQAAKAQQEAAYRNAEIARLEGRAKESQVRRDAARELAAARAQAAASGITTDQSSSMLALADIAGQQEEKALLVRYGGEAKARRAEQRGNAMGSKAKATLILGGAKTLAAGARAGYQYQTEFPS